MKCVAGTYLSARFMPEVRGLGQSLIIPTKLMRHETEEVMTWKLVLLEAIYLAVISLLLAGVYNALAPRQRSLAWIGARATGDTPSRVAPPIAPSGAGKTGSGVSLAAIAPPKDPALLYMEINGNVAERLHAAGALFVDARRSDAYEKGHIGSARSIAVWERDADEKIGGLQKEGIPFEQVIVVYCSGGDCTDSATLSEKLAMAGFYNLYVYKDGFPDWVRRGLPVKEGAKP